MIYGVPIWIDGEIVRVPKRNCRIDMYLSQRSEGIPMGILVEDYQYVNDRVVIAEGLIIAVEHIEEVMEILQSSKDNAEAKTLLVHNMDFSEIQAKEVLKMQLNQLILLEREHLEEEKKKYQDIEKYLNLRCFCTGGSL